MSNSNCKHEIDLLNLENNELVNHQYLLIKGLIKPNTKCIKSIELQCEDLPTHNILKADGHISDRFKFLIDLGFVNKLIKFTFIYCTKRLSITINYKLSTKQFKVCPLLILCNDESENDRTNLYCKTIDLNLRLLQCVYSDILRESTQERKTFQLIEKCHIFQTRLSRNQIWASTPSSLWQDIARELLQSEWGQNDRLKFVAIVNCTKYEGEKIPNNTNWSYENMKQYIKGHVALGGGGLALFGSVYFYCWPNQFQQIMKCFNSSRKVDIRKFPDESNYRRTWGAVYASTLGAMCHELGHIFDLGHTQTGIMGTGFDFINRVFTLNPLTEHLPERLIKEKDKSKATQNLQSRITFTKFTKPANGFLDNFHMQKNSDGFYFMRNSALTLAHHVWFRDDVSQDFISNQFNIIYNAEEKFIESENVPLKLIEIRSEEDALTIEWYELQKSIKEKPVYKYNLQTLKTFYKGEHYLFILSDQGHIKRFAL